MKEKILIVDDEPDILEVLDSILTEGGFDVTRASGGREAIDLFKSESFEVLITDIRMPEVDGLEVMKQVRKMDNDVEIIVLTGFPAVDVAVRTLKDYSAFDFLTKPLRNIQHICITVNQALERRRLHQEKKTLFKALTQANQDLKQEIEERKKAEEALRESEEKLRALLNATTDTIILVDNKGFILSINESGARRIGKTVDEIVGRALNEFFSPDIANPRTAKIKEVICSGQPVRFKDERDEMMFDNHFYPVFDSKGKVVQLAIYSRDITEQVKAVNALRQREEELQMKTANLEEANTALKVLLKKRDEDRTEIEEKVLFNVNELIKPYMKKLKKGRLDNAQKVYLEIIESNLKDIVSPFIRGLSPKYLKLTPQEIQIANLVKQGKTTKEIASFLNLSPRTVEYHRNSIRKKIGLRNEKVNLRTYLLSIQ